MGWGLSDILPPDPNAASAPASGAGAAPDAGAAATQFPTVAPRLLTPDEGGDGTGMTNLSPADHARFAAGLGPDPATAVPVSNTPPPDAPSVSGTAKTPAKSGGATSWKLSDILPPVDASAPGAPPAAAPAVTSAAPVAPAAIAPAVPATPPIGPTIPTNESGAFAVAPQVPAQKAPADPGVFANIGAGGNDALAGMAGAPVDLVTGGLNLASRGVRAATGLNLGQITNPVGGSDFFRSGLGLVGADPRNVAAPDGPDQLGRAIGSGAVSALVPWGVANALRPLAGIAGAVQQSVGAGGAATQALTGASGAIGGRGLEQVAPDSLKPLANMVGNVLGGAPVLAASRLPVMAPVVSDLATHYTAPFTDAGRQTLAGQRIVSGASNPAAVRATLNDMPDQLVPGSAPTTFQITGDQGIGRMERAAAAQSSDQFKARAGEQNAARNAVIDQLSPQDASVEAVSKHFRGMLDWLTTKNDAQTGAAQATAMARTSELPGAVPVGADQQATRLQQYGQQIRGAAADREAGTPGIGLAGNNSAAHAAEREFWESIDPDNTLRVNVQPVRDAAKKLHGERSAYGTPIEGAPARILDLAQRLPDTVPFRDLAAFRESLTTAMAKELRDNGHTPSYREMSLMLDSVHDAMAESVGERATQEGEAVASGHMNSEQTMEARLRKQADDWKRQRAAAGEYAAGSGAEGVGNGPGAGSAGMPGMGGSESTTKSRPGNTGGDPGMAPPQPDVDPNFDAAAAQRYQSARNATAERHATFTNAPGVGAVLAPGRTSGEFKMPDSAVPAAIFNGGKGAAERVKAYFKAGGDHTIAEHYLAFDLRRAAEQPDGTLNPAKTAAWLKSQAEVMTTFPDLAAKFKTAAAARDAVDSAAATAKTEQDAFEKSAVRPFLGDADPIASIGKILRSDTSEAQMRQLAQLSAGNPAAQAGLRRVVAEFIQREMRSNAEEGTSGVQGIKSDQFQTFFKRAAPALRHVFTPDQVEGIGNVAADLRRSNRSVSGSKLAGQSNTAQDMAAMEKHHGKPSMVLPLLLAEGAGEAGASVGGLAGRAIGMIGVPLLNAMRQAGLSKVDDLVTEAMLHPEIARALVAKIPEHGAGTVTPVLARMIRGLAVRSAVFSGRREPDAPQ